MATKEELEKRNAELEAKLKQEEQSRRETEKMFQLVINSIPQFIFWKDTVSVYLGCNSNFAQAAGVENPENIVGKTDYDLAWKKEEADAFRADDREVMDNDTPKLNIVEPQLQADGKQAWLETNKIPLHDDKDKVIGVLGTFADITERKQAELAANFAQFSVDRAADQIFGVDPDGGFVYVNNATCESLGYSREELLNMTIFDIAPKISPEVWPERAERLKQVGAMTFESEHQAKDGHTYPIEITLNYLEYQGQEYNFAFARNIADRKRTEEERERMLNIVESSADFIALATPEGVGIYINPSGLEMIGYTQEEFDAGMNIAHVQPDLSPEVFQIAISEGMWSGESTLIRKNGNKINISQTITSLKDEAGNLQGFSTIIRDITEVKQSEVDRERLQKEVIEAQQRAIAELSTPVIPIMDRIIVMPMVGSIDSMRARDITRALLAGIGHHRAKVVILDVTGVSLMDTGIVNHLNKTIQAARLKGAQTIVTGISDAVAESIVDLGIDWSGITTLSDLQTGLLVALDSLGVRLTQ